MMHDRCRAHGGRAVGTDDLLLQDQRDLELAGGQAERVVGSAGVVPVAEQVPAGESAVDVEPCEGHGVVVVPEPGRLLPVVEVVHVSLPGQGQLFRVSVARRLGDASVQVE
ncbi:hypothetical protein A6035_11870 [Dietzia lutea]|uniref:Uncharacterized protein n=1 Tax=Dietzia lutea TaxID=546160 RepID=A0A2S1R8Y3_9ACTN|nr:hypothetical protein A6035_11870 [Dietzia lutea]